MSPCSQNRLFVVRRASYLRRHTRLTEMLDVGGVTSPVRSRALGEAIEVEILERSSKDSGASA